MISIFSQTLKELRQERNLTQKELAYDLNYTQSNISEWENGTVEPKATALTAISTYFGVSIDYLLGLENDYGARTVSTTASSSDSLTEKEKALLRAFKKLLPEMQDFILQSAQSLSDKASAKSLK